MTHRVAKIAGSTAALLGLTGVVSSLLASDEESLVPARHAVADLPTVRDFAIHADATCAYDPDRGGLVLRGVTVSSASTGVLEVTFHAQGESLDEILPGYVSTVLTFDEDTRSHTFDLTIPASRADVEAGYDSCQWATGGD